MPGSNKNSVESRTKEMRKTNFKRQCKKIYNRNFRPSLVFVKNDTNRIIKVQCSGKIRLQTSEGSLTVKMRFTMDGVNGRVRTGQENYEVEANSITSWVHPGTRRKLISTGS